MTRAYGEANPTRQFDEHTQRIDALSKRPAPLTEGGDTAWGRISRRFADSNQTISTGSLVEIQTTTDYNLSAGQSGNGVFTASHGGGTNVLTVAIDAVILVHARVYWLSSLTNPWILWVSNTMVANMNEAHFPGLGGSTDDAGDFEFHTRVQAGTDFSFGVRHQDGANRDVDAAMLDIMVMGTYTGTDFDAMDPDFA